MKNLESQPVQQDSGEFPKIEALHPAAEQTLQAADRLLRTHELQKGTYGIIHIDPGEVTLGLQVRPSELDPEWMTDIEVTVTPHRPEVTPAMFGDTHVAINDGGVPERTDLWRLAPLSRTEGKVTFHAIPRKAISRLRFVFKEEREALRKKRSQKQITNQ